MMDAKSLSAAIRAKKKKLMNSDPELVDNDSKPNLNPMDMMNVDQKAQIEGTVDSPDKINADDTAMNEPYVQKPMSKEPMQSHVNPSNHHKMAYGGEVMEHADPFMPSPEMEREYVAGSPESNQEMSRRFSNGPSVGVGEGQGPELGDGEMSEEARRIKARKMRLSGYLDSQIDF
jgi:hypothetical protein